MSRIISKGNSSISEERLSGIASYSELMNHMLWECNLYDNGNIYELKWTGINTTEWWETESEYAAICYHEKSGKYFELDYDTKIVTELFDYEIEIVEEEENS